MKKIAFLCRTSGKNSKELLEWYKYFTPNHSGVWKNLIGIDNIEKADYYVVIEDIPKQLKGLFDHNKIIYFQSEPSYLRCNKILKKSDTKLYDFNYENYHHPIVWFSRVPFNDFENMKYVVKDKQLGCIISGFKSRRKVSGYNIRLNFLNKFVEKYPDKMEVYGRGMTPDINPLYKGAIDYDDLAKVYQSFNYSFVCENGTEKGQISDRINDCILNWSIPIYWGDPDIYTHYPKDSLYTIDINNQSIDDLYNISQRLITDINIKALKKAREIILYKDNMWEKIYKTIGEK